MMEAKAWCCCDTTKYIKAVERSRLEGRISVSCELAVRVDTISNLSGQL